MSHARIGIGSNFNEGEIKYGATQLPSDSLTVPSRKLCFWNPAASAALNGFRGSTKEEGEKGGRERAAPRRTLI